MRFGMSSDVLFLWLWMGLTSAAADMGFFSFLFFYFFGVRADGGQWLILWG